MNNSITWLQWLYLLPFALIWLLFLRRRQQREQLARLTLHDTTAAGLTEPMSLHPLIDPLKCVGSGGCVSACPEGAVIGIIDGKASLIDPTRCIGHGACAEACPHKAIELVFGTARRGMDIPVLADDFQTNISGIYIAGELGGMGLIRNAIAQGQQAMAAIAASLTEAEAASAVVQSDREADKATPMLDVVIIGAGPAGLAAALSAKAQGLNYQVLEQESLGGTIAHYPRGKVVMTQPAELPIVGRFQFREVSKETLMQFWTQTAQQQNLAIETGHRVEQVVQDGEGFTISSQCAATTSRQLRRARRVLLCIGRRGTPRKLGIPGEDSPNVVYRLIDPEQYRHQSILVVGGGDSALEAALALSDQPGTRVTLCYRGRAFNRARSKNREALNDKVIAHRIQLLLNANPTHIHPHKVDIHCSSEQPDTDQDVSVQIDTVLIAAGGELPTAFLKQIGIQVDTRYGTA